MVRLPDQQCRFLTGDPVQRRGGLQPIAFATVLRQEEIASQPRKVLRIFDRVFAVRDLQP
jgi:hypothetical protein